MISIRVDGQVFINDQVADLANLTEKLREAQMKKELGVPARQVLRELGYEGSQWTGQSEQM